MPYVTRNADNEIVSYGEVPQYPGQEYVDAVELSLNQARGIKLDQINNEYDRVVRLRKKKYPDWEASATWTQQLEEAQAYDANPSANVPLLTQIAQNAPSLGRLFKTAWKSLLSEFLKIIRNGQSSLVK